MSQNIQSSLQNNENEKKFIAIFNIGVGSLNGIFIAMPIVLANEQGSSLNIFLGIVIFIALGLIGAFVGYRRRASRFFLYLNLIISIILIRLMVNSLSQ